jgi:hypothetical protein
MEVAAGGAKLASMDIMVQEFDLVGLGQSFRTLGGVLFAVKHRAHMSHTPMSNFFLEQVRPLKPISFRALRG